MKRKYEIYDAFEDRDSAERNAIDLRKSGETATIRKISQDSKRLKFGIFTAGKRKRFI